MPFQVCVRCDRGPLACDAYGVCGSCQTPLRNETLAGLAQLALYLKRHADFAAWLDDHREEEDQP